METENEAKSESCGQDGLKAKYVSLWAKILAGALLVVCAVLKWCGVMANADVQEIAIVAYGITGLFGTVDINLMLEKFSRK